MNRCAARILWTLGGAWVLGAGSPAGATWQDDIGFTRLAADLGAALPKGAGVAVTQVEATGSDEGEYRASDSSFPTTGNFASKSFIFKSGPPATVSGHASRVGAFFYGLNTDAGAGDASVAPLAGTGPSARVTGFETNDWLATGFLRWSGSTPNNALLPRSESSAVANHSWISVVDNDLTPAQANEQLRRLDYSIRASDYVTVVGVNNGVGTAVPQLLASAFNVLAIGLTNGGHSTGTTPADVDGGGRTKPELVAPLSAASWACGVVSGCTALLTERAASLSPASVATDAQRSVVLRAVLLAGASKKPFLSHDGALTWAQTATRPLDPHFGAGEVNVWRSHRVLTGGRFAPAGSQVAGPSGWHYDAGVAAGGERVYFLAVPSGCRAAEFSAALVWDRRIALASSGVWSTPTPELADLNLHLHDATGFVPGAERASSSSGAGGSVPHPLEHVYARDLPAGGYALRVTSGGPTTTDYGLAWLTALEPAQAASMAAAMTGDRSSLVLSFSGLGTSLTYEVQRSDDLFQWTTVHTFVAAGGSAGWNTATGPGRGFFRLVWVP